MRSTRLLQLVVLVLLSVSLLVACGRSTKKPDIPIPTVVAVLEKPYVDVGTQEVPTEAPTEPPTEGPGPFLTSTPSDFQPPRDTSEPILIPTPNLSATAPYSGTATPNPNSGPYPIATGVPTVSFGTPVDPYPIGTQTATPTAPPGLPIGLASGSAVYTLNNATNTLQNQSFTAINPDQSAVWLRNKAQLTLLSPSASCSGSTTSLPYSLSSGLNACMLTLEESTLTLNGGTVTTFEKGSSGLFALGNSSKINVNETIVATSAEGARGASAENGGSIELINVRLSTLGKNATGVYTNLGGSNAMVRNSTITTAGNDAPCFYTNVTLRTENTSCSADLAEAVIVENNGKLELRQSNLATKVLTRWGVLLYQGTSRDANTATAEFNMRGGILNVTDTNSPVFFVTNVNATINLSEVDVRAASGVILKAGGQLDWGTAGANGGNVSLLLTNQPLKGDIQTDNLSSVVIEITENSSLEGAINNSDTAKSLTVVLDATSTWTLTKNSFVPEISGVVLVDGRVVNIIGNNFKLYYDPATSSALLGKTYQLTGGGTLAPHP